MPKSPSSSQPRSAVTSTAGNGRVPVEPNGAVTAQRLAVPLSALTPAVIEGRPHWPSVAVAAWLETALALGLYATDRTYELIDSLRDGDDCYAGTVQVGQELLDLYVDPAGVLRVAPEYRYLT
jgi:hypothetical protein